MRMPGVEPGSQAWEACMIPLHYMRCWHFSSTELSYSDGTAAQPTPPSSCPQQLPPTWCRQARLGVCCCPQSGSGQRARRPAAVRPSWQRKVQRQPPPCSCEAARRCPACSGLQPVMPTARRKRGRHALLRLPRESRARSAHAGSRARVTSMGGLYDTATLHALVAVHLH